MSIDALRGLDMFMITGGNHLAEILAVFFTLPRCIQEQTRHVRWEGFSAWDLIMPLFLFIAGTSLPFSFGKRLAEGQSRKQLLMKTLRRVLVLWILGMVAQGNLLDFDLSKLYLFSNTLQAIAVGYLVASLALIYLPVFAQFALACGLLAVFWLLMMLVPSPDCPAGTMEEQHNLARFVDEFVLRGFRNQAPDYTYTWILSGLGFAGSVLLGVMSGHLLRSGWAPWKKTAGLILAGTVCLALGWIWSGGFGWLDAWRFPIIKHIWTSSMVLWAAGWCYLLLAVFYVVVDVLGFRKSVFFFTVLGSNAIVAYMLASTVDFGHIADGFVGGLMLRFNGWGGPWPAYASALQHFAAFSILWLILLYMHRKGSFVRV